MVNRMARCGKVEVTQTEKMSKIKWHTTLEAI